MKRIQFLPVIMLVCSLLLIQPVTAQPTISYVPLITGLTQPVDIVTAGDGTNRLFVVEQGGTIKVYSSTYVLLGTFLTVTGISTGGEQGLLSMAFHPDYETNGFFWVYYTNTAGNLEVSRYRVSAGNANQADAASRQVVITISHPTFSNHNGAKLNFGSDGFLYFATGDGGSGGDPANNAQNGGNLLGKMLRINVSTGTTAPFYTIPASNPFVANPAIADEIWALGLRNPFRWSFDRTNGDMWIGDVGQDAREEINYRAAASTGGINYGWRCYEGNLPFNTNGCQAQSNYVFPVYDYANPSPGQASVTGGYVYRGTSYPAMQGFYFATDVYSGNLYRINASNFTTTIQTGLPNLVVGFGETENGDELLAVSLNGTAYALRPTTPTSVNTVNNLSNAPRLYPTLVNDGILRVHLKDPMTQLQIFTTSGVLVQQQVLTGRTGLVEIALQHRTPGTYLVRMSGRKQPHTARFSIGR